MFVMPIQIDDHRVASKIDQLPVSADLDNYGVLDIVEHPAAFDRAKPMGSGAYLSVRLSGSPRRPAQLTSI
jgi:hypothetical protein